MANSGSSRWSQRSFEECFCLLNTQQDLFKSVKYGTKLNFLYSFLVRAANIKFHEK